MSKLLYGDLSYRIRKCIFDVHNHIGVGYDEETYHQGLIRRFKKEGFVFSSKEKRKLEHRAKLIREFILDFLIEDKIILSLKSLPCDFLQNNYIQLITELKIWQKHVGIIANFGLPKVNIERRVFHEKLFSLDENYDYIKDKMSENESRLMKKIRQAIIFVGHFHGLGFGKSVIQKLVEAEFEYQKIDFLKGVPVPIYYFDEKIRTYKMRCLLIEKNIICGITALQNTITYHDISKIKSYLQALNKNIGLAINFGKSKLEIRGITNNF